MAYPCDDAKFHFNGKTYNESDFRDLLGSFELNKLSDLAPETVNRAGGSKFQDLAGPELPGPIARMDNRTQALARQIKGELAAPLYSKAAPTEPEEKTKSKALESIKTLLAKTYIYDGKRDVSPTEAAMNIIRTGYLAGISVLKTNVLGNSVNIFFEQAAKPLMATADILNPKTEARTVPGLSVRDILQGFFGENGLFRSELGISKAEIGKSGILKSGVTLKKGFAHALIHGVDHQEASRTDMNIGDKNKTFVRNTGVPLIDLTIEITKRIVTGVDRPFKAYARSSELSGLARLAASKDKRGFANTVKNAVDADWRKRMLELRSDPTELMNDVAERYAEVVTFQNPNVATQTYDKFRRFLIDDRAQARIIPAATQRRIAKYVGSALYLASGQVAPFMSTPSNVGFRTLEYFFPTGIVATAFKFYRIGNSFERQNYTDEEGLRRAKIIKRLAAVRRRQDQDFNRETSEKKKRLAAQKTAKLDDYKKLIGAVRNSAVLTDAAKTARISEIEAAREKWLNGFDRNLEKYLEERRQEAEKGTAQRKVVDGIQKDDWDSADAYADIKFSEFENRAFAEAAGRAGFGATAGGLALLGVIYGLVKAVGSTEYDDEKEKSKAKREGAIPDDSIELFGYRFPYSDTPFGKALNMGINLFEQYERPGRATVRASAMAKRFGQDATSLNPLTAQEFNHNDWASWAGSKANSMTPILNLKILQELGEVIDDKPRKYFDEGFLAQYLIHIPGVSLETGDGDAPFAFGRGTLPESTSYPGGNEERGGFFRRAARAVDPLKTTRPNISQDELPITPLEKDAPVTKEDQIKNIEQLIEQSDNPRQKEIFQKVLDKLKEQPAPAGSSSTARPFRQFRPELGRQSENVIDLTDNNAADARAAEKWSGQRQSQNVIDMRENKPLAQYIQSLEAGDAENAAKWKVRLDQENLTEAERQEVARARNFYLKNFTAAGRAAVRQAGRR